MKILYVLQPSVSDGKVYLEADSNIYMMKGILKQIHEGKEITVLIPYVNNYKHKNLFPQGSNIRFHLWDYPSNAWQAKWHFNHRDLPKEDFDIVWCNIAEQTAAFKNHYKNSKVVYCNYFMDTPMNPKTHGNVNFLRQVEGAMCADLVAFTCESTKYEFLDAIERFVNKPYMLMIKNKSAIWDFGFSSEELNKHKVEQTIPPLILFPNRITKPDYTKFGNFVEAVKMLKGKFQVAVTNPSQKYYTHSQIAEMVPNYHFVSNEMYTREEMIKLLWQAKASVHLFTGEKYGGCAHREAIFCNTIPVTPQCNEYHVIQGSKYPFYTDCEPNSLAATLQVAIGMHKYHESLEFRQIKQSNSFSCYEVIKDKVLDNLEDLIK